MRRSIAMLAFAGTAGLAICTAALAQSGSAVAQAPHEAAALTAADADAFVARAERELAEFSLINNRAQWVNATYITDDTNALAAYFGTIDTEMRVRLAGEAARYANVSGLSADTRRKLGLLRNGLVLAAPTTAGAAAELNRISTDLASQYGRGHATMNGETIDGNETEARMGTVRDPTQLREMWTSWNDNVGSPMRGEYQRLVEIANQGARELGYPDTGAMWRSKYDMSPEEFQQLTERLWQQVRPLYEELHCYVRAGLNRRYGDQVQPATGPIRADLLGNLWAQEWGNIYDVVAPPNSGPPAYDLTQLLENAHYTPQRIVQTAEGFFTSLGFDPLPQTFWERSQITQPRDRNVICHASAWDIDNRTDVRLKMCTRVNADDFVTAHHELGHNFYQRAYMNQPFLYEDSANDGIHEAIGDTIALSVTPEYLHEIGLLQANQMPTPEQDRNLLLRQALDKIAFLPFGLMIDRYRWGIFSGQIPANQYQAAWDRMRLQYQGIVPPSPRTEQNFDAGAKYHVPASVPYTRYFLARILQFQFFKAACDIAGWHGPLHRCSFYGNREVGRRLNQMLELGLSRPWPEAIQTFTGTREISAQPMMDYFQPLMGWLREQNRGRQCGWRS
ncbi:M2 family metallopeptidase [Sphingosinicella ginsenosidimutans]|uniref:M2 family metallopeptidase n=1 Tax=Allosphingosinicella ginsenosidimutans TaxID=1176539 RepID=A0A5C6TV72_9SPHN|nr:M2 family metallopeptidase [Sphingosinicella ginsenosidimutans]TXC64302.1 M2 family metallopeptidase [Sphingosinicella ginsenosidimutans]